jgi:signal transduction histidine kinase
VLLILSGLLAAAVAMVLTFFLSQRIVAPVESLAKVAQSVARQDFSVRAEVKSRDEVGELSRIFNSMIVDLSHTEELRRNLVADLAHELRTPVTNVRGYIEGVADGVMAPDTTTLGSMHDEVLLLSRLIDDLQDLALAESGKLPFQRQPCDLGGVAQRALAAVQQRAQARQITLQVDVPAELPFQADPERISQVLRNLLANAVEYTPRGGQVSLRAWDCGPEIQLAVRDTGPGIPAEDLPYIFERFYRVDKSRSRATGGVGLGLTIARRLVEAHGGNLSVRSEPGEGTEFMVRLPRNGEPLT